MIGMKMIYKIPDTSRFVISSHRVWKPGSFDSERTARYAFRFRDSQLQRLQDSVGTEGVITFQMLKEEKRTFSLTA